MTQQGKAITFEQKQYIINLKKAFDLEKNNGPAVPTKDSVGRIAGSLDIGRRTVESILSEYNKNGQKLIKKTSKTRGKPHLKISGDMIPRIRSHIRSANLQGQHVSVRKLRSWLIQEFDADIPLTTLHPSDASVSLRASANRSMLGGG